MLEPACAPSSDDPSGSVGLWVPFRSGGFLSPLADLRRRARGLPDLTPTAALLLVRGSSAARSGDRTASWSLVLFLQG
ncbi:hypothetical protein SLEP1_g46122 [Rubroshorea leprosula]|uniref:Uncharacterized protein n=1 Tax=Rubroshorea leprosula TaxID=152421 RepID=A0AAV5LMR4_9ROSI|nr:hypothetical protein SLEP1_g46122 [Rubroshorea leprosula]